MITLSTALAFVLPVPALRDHPQIVAFRRRRAVAALRLAPHLLKDVGLDDFATPGDDPRWVRQFELDR
jgi:hypothetical protein